MYSKSWFKKLVNPRDHYFSKFNNNFVILFRNLLPLVATKYTYININKGYFKFLLSDKDAVEKRLFVLQQQGYIYATDLS